MAGQAAIAAAQGGARQDLGPERRRWGAHEIHREAGGAAGDLRRTRSARARCFPRVWRIPPHAAPRPQCECGGGAERGGAGAFLRAARSSADARRAAARGLPAVPAAAYFQGRAAAAADPAHRAARGRGGLRARVHARGLRHRLRSGRGAGDRRLRHPPRRHGAVEGGGDGRDDRARGRGPHPRCLPHGLEGEARARPPAHRRGIRPHRRGDRRAVESRGQHRGGV